MLLVLVVQQLLLQERLRSPSRSATDIRRDWTYN